MDDFAYRDGVLWGEQVPLPTVAERFGTPSYVYSRHTLVDHYQRFAAAFGELEPLVCFSVKVLSNLHLLRLLGQAGAGADAVSGGEVYRALRAGIDPEKIVLAGVGKSEDELREAVRHGIRSINVESAGEVDLLSRIAREEGRCPRLAIRVNPDVAPDQRTPAQTTTGTRGSKFGVDLELAGDLFRRAASDGQLRMRGLHFHLGSPIFEPRAYGVALDRIMALVGELGTDGHRVDTIDVGGGYPAEYTESTAPSWDEYAQVIVPRLAGFARAGGQVVFEPGRTIAANAGVLLTRVRYLKRAGDRRVAVLDAGMSHLMRTALYDSYHFMWPVAPGTAAVPRSRQQPAPHPAGLVSAGLVSAGLVSVDLVSGDLIDYDVVGPICESTDYFARDRALPRLSPGDLVAIFATGAYGMSMTSNYNSQPRPAEVLLRGGQATLIRRRERYEDLVATELELGVPEPGPARAGDGDR